MGEGSWVGVQQRTRITGLGFDSVLPGADLGETQLPLEIWLGPSETRQ